MDTSVLSALFPPADLPSDFVWIGLSDREEEAVYRWVSDGDLLEEGEEDGGYDNWYQGEAPFRQEPDGGTEENCVIAQVGAQCCQMWPEGAVMPKHLSKSRAERRVARWF